MSVGKQVYWVLTETPNSFPVKIEVAPGSFSRPPVSSSDMAQTSWEWLGSNLQSQRWNCCSISPADVPPASGLFSVIWCPSVPPPCSQCPPAQPSFSFLNLPPVYDQFLRWDPKLQNPSLHPCSCCSSCQCPQVSDKNTGKIAWGFNLVQPPRALLLSINILLSPGCLCPSANSQCPGSHLEGSQLFSDYRLFPLPLSHIYKRV